MPSPAGWVLHFDQLSVMRVVLTCWWFQIVVNTGTNATEYEEAEVVEGSRVNRDMAFDHTGDFVYVVTLRKVGHCPEIIVISVLRLCVVRVVWVCVRVCVLECVIGVSCVYVCHQYVIDKLCSCVNVLSMS